MLGTRRPIRARFGHTVDFVDASATDASDVTAAALTLILALYGAIQQQCASQSGPVVGIALTDALECRMLQRLVRLGVDGTHDRLQRIECGKRRNTADASFLRRVGLTVRAGPLTLEYAPGLRK